MKALKDLFHNINDILIALIILVIAAFLIFWRVEVIMAYPDTLEKESKTTKTTQKNAISDDKSKDKSNAKGNKDNKDNKDNQNSDNKEIYTEGKLSTSTSVTIPEGSYMDAVKALIDKKLFTSEADFEQVCAQAGVDPNAIKASTFSFDAGATKADIAVTVTQ